MLLYGRRRVGKTRLLTHWQTTSPTARAAKAELGGREPTGRRALYWVATPSSALDQLRSFSQAIYNFANPSAPAPPDFTYATWPQAWQQVANLAADSRLALFVDEFTYLLEVDPSVAGMLQNAWDHVLKQANLLLVLSGSDTDQSQHKLGHDAAPCVILSGPAVWSSNRPVAPPTAALWRHVRLRHSSGHAFPTTMLPNESPFTPFSAVFLLIGNG